MGGSPGTSERRMQQTRDIAERLLLACRLKALAPSGEFSIDDAVDVALFLTEAMMRDAGIGVLKDLSPGLPRIAAPMGQVEQILVNVLLNAVQAVEKTRGLVRIVTRGDRSTVRVTVEDNGPGTDEETVSRVFDAFYSRWGGLGLGLTVARDIARRFGGEITFESDPGIGSRVHITLPANVRPAAPRVG